MKNLMFTHKWNLVNDPIKKVADSDNSVSLVIVSLRKCLCF